MISLGDKEKARALPEKEPALLQYLTINHGFTPVCSADTESGARNTLPPSDGENSYPGSSPLANKEILSSQLGSPKQIFLAGGKDV